MFSKENIRGFVFVVAIIVVIALVVILARPRQALYLAESKGQKEEVTKQDSLFAFDPTP